MPDPLRFLDHHLNSNLLLRGSIDGNPGCRTKRPSPKYGFHHIPIKRIEINCFEMKESGFHALTVVDPWHGPLDGGNRPVTPSRLPSSYFGCSLGADSMDTMDSMDTIDSLAPRLVDSMNAMDVVALYGLNGLGCE
jgi:hypothetical protein